MTLEERIAEALREHMRYAPPLTTGESMRLARAVVTVLPTADVTDAQIAEALAYPQVECVACRGVGEVEDENWSPEFRGDARSFGRGLINCGLCGGDGWRYDDDESAQVARVRALLDGQAAAHAAEVDGWKGFFAAVQAENEQLRQDEALQREECGEYAEEVEALRAEVERLTESLDYANQGKAALEAKVAAVEALRESDADEVAYHWCRECGGTEMLWSAIEDALAQEDQR